MENCFNLFKMEEIKPVSSDVQHHKIHFLVCRRIAVIGKSPGNKAHSMILHIKLLLASTLGQVKNPTFFLVCNVATSTFLCVTAIDEVLGNTGCDVYWSPLNGSFPAIIPLFSCVLVYWSASAVRVYGNK